MKTIIKLGNKVMVSDPCYGLGTWCQGVLENVLPGNYKCSVEYSDEGDWGERVAAIEVRHKDYSDFIPMDMEEFEVGVDSGQAGIFDYDYYAKYHDGYDVRPHVNDDWYGRVCNLTYEKKENTNYKPFDMNYDGLSVEDVLKKMKEFEAYRESDESCKYIGCLTANQIDGLGFVSSSGFGDGCYTCWTAREESGYIVAIRVEFITEYDEEDDDE